MQCVVILVGQIANLATVVGIGHNDRITSKGVKMLVRSQLCLRLGLLIASVLLFSQAAWVRSISLDTQRISVNDVDRIEILGMAGTIELVPVEGATQFELQVHYDLPKGLTDGGGIEDWEMKVESVGKTWNIRVLGPKSKDAWRSAMLKNLFPQYHMKLMGPSRPVEIHWRDLRLTSTSWKSELQVQALVGDYQIRQGQGDLILRLDSGKISVSGQKGIVDVESFGVEAELSNNSGNCRLVNFSGTSKVSNLLGDLNYRSMLGTSNLSLSDGNLEFQNGRGALNITAKDGRIFGNTDSGNVRATSLGKTDISIKSKEAFVNVITAKGSGAKVNVGSVEGDLFVPPGFKVDRYPNLKVATGRLPGSLGGAIHVRTETGGVRVR
jgi:hypothetical protein